MCEIRRKNEISGHTFYHTGTGEESIGAVDFFINRRFSDKILLVQVVSSRVWTKKIRKWNDTSRRGRPPNCWSNDIKKLSTNLVATSQDGNKWNTLKQWTQTEALWWWCTFLLSIAAMAIIHSVSCRLAVKWTFKLQYHYLANIMKDAHAVVIMSI